MRATVNRTLFWASIFFSNSFSVDFKKFMKNSELLDLFRFTCKNMWWWNVFYIWLICICKWITRASFTQANHFPFTCIKNKRPLRLLCFFNKHLPFIKRAIWINYFLCISMPGYCVQTNTPMYFMQTSIPKGPIYFH